MTNEQFVWKYLYEKLRNVYGVAGLMGNLVCESSLNPWCANGVKKINMTNTSYTLAVDRKEYDKFATDGIAYGLVQWCYKTRKQGLLDLAQKTNRSIGSIDLQLDYMWQELQSYKTVLEKLYNADNVKEVSDAVMLRYEKPANKSEQAKEKRALQGEKYLNKYGNKTIQFNVSAQTANDLWEAIKKGFD